MIFLMIKMYFHILISDFVFRSFLSSFSNLLKQLLCLFSNLSKQLFCLFSNLSKKFFAVFKLIKVVVLPFSILSKQFFAVFKLIKAVVLPFSNFSKQVCCFFKPGKAGFLLFSLYLSNKNSFRVTHVLLRHIVIIYLFDKENTNGTIYQSGTASLWQCSY